MYSILMTTLFKKALILQGEIWCWSLLGLKGLSNINFQWTKTLYQNNLKHIAYKIYSFEGL